MTRTSILAMLVALHCSVSSPAAADTFSESFNGQALSNRLSMSSSSSAYELSPATPGQSWQMTKQAGTATGAVEIQTNFIVSGNFTAALSLDGSDLGTGEVGMRLGEIYVNPWAEIHFHGPDSGRGTIYVPGGYGIGGFAESTHPATLRWTRNGSDLRYYVNGRLFMRTTFEGDSPLTIFLRPYSGNGAFDPTVGQPDAHAATLHHFTLTADAFIPEPATLALLVAGAILTWTTARQRRT